MEKGSGLRSNDASYLEPIAVIPGLLTGSYTYPLYAPLLNGETRSQLSSKERYITIPHHGLGDKDEMYNTIEEKLNATHEREERPLVILGHSLGAYFATKFAHEHPEKVNTVVCLAGVQEGIREENAYVLGLKTLVEILGQKGYPHILHHSENMQEHRNKIKNSWSGQVKLDLIASAYDVLLPLPHGLGLKLPKGQSARTYVLGLSTLHTRKIHGIPKQTLGYPGKLLFSDHCLAPRNPNLLNHMRIVRSQTPKEPQPRIKGTSHLDLDLAA